MKAPYKCPICGEYEGWKLVDESRKGFSGGKALLGGILLGPLGIIAGAIGNKKRKYYCTRCQFTNDYDA